MNITNSRFIFVRHGNTDKATPDLARQLTEKGREQAVALRQKMGLESVTFDHVMTSSAGRTEETALTLLGGNVPEKITPLPALYRLPDEGGKVICDAMFKEVGYADLWTYLDHRDADTLHRLGETGCIAVAEVVGEDVSNKNVLIVGHAVLLNILIYHMFSTNQQVKGVALMTVMGECGAIEVAVGPTPIDTVVRIIN